MTNIKKNLNGKNILVTGGTGSIGKEIVRQCLAYSPKVVRIFSNDENSLFEANVEFGHFPNTRFLHGDVRDFERLKRSFENIDIVFHAAAMKHVPICEYDPIEAIKTNIIGTENVIKAAVEQKVGQVVTISSDKAVNPTTTMGATKLMAEKVTIDGNNYGVSYGGSFSCVRFGNVIASRGSVVPLFLNQLESGGPVTVTDKKMSRFFMSISEAADLVLSTTSIMKGREIFVLKSMSSIRIIDLAEAMVDLYEEKTGIKREIQIIGKRSNEKDYEVLMTEVEMEGALENNNFYIINCKNDNDFDTNNSGRYEDFKEAKNFLTSSENVDFLEKNQIKKLLVPFFND